MTRDLGARVVRLLALLVALGCGLPGAVLLVMSDPNPRSAWLLLLAANAALLLGHTVAAWLRPNRHER